MLTLRKDMLRDMWGSVLIGTINKQNKKWFKSVFIKATGQNRKKIAI